VTERYVHFGWSASPYSAKTRAYLRFKRAPYVVPDSMDAIFTTLFDEQFAFVAELFAAIDSWCEE